MNNVLWIVLSANEEQKKTNKKNKFLTNILVRPNHPQITPLTICIVRSADQVYGDVLDYEKYRVDLYSDGTVNFYTAGKTTTFCKLDLTYFPFDVQACYIHIDSWTYSESQVLLNSTDGKLITSLYHPNGQWQLVNTEVDLFTIWHDWMFPTRDIIFSQKNQKGEILAWSCYDLAIS